MGRERVDEYICKQANSKIIYNSPVAPHKCDRRPEEHGERVGAHVCAVSVSSLPKLLLPNGGKRMKISEHALIMKPIPIALKLLFHSIPTRKEMQMSI